MLGRIDTPEDAERERRSIAMLSPGAPALDREEAMHVLGALVAALTAVRRHPEAIQNPESD